ncbi:MAG: IclR family transcriptional regulator [Bryobacterales bacterium]|nr:IclR family transcriptional regulator [Bryobacterales bacterium]
MPINTRDYGVSSVRKALELLGCFTPRATSWTLSDLARAVRMPKSTTHNLLRTLHEFDLVRQDPQTRSYRLGPRALELGLTFAKGTDMLSHARPVLSRLAEASGETVKLGMLSQGQVLVIAAVESTRQLHTRGDVGTRWPLHSSSLGKAILSVLPSEEAADILARHGMPRFTQSTVTTWAEMQREIQRIRSRGYALDLEENEPGVCCVAAALADPLNRTVAAISVSGPSVRMKAGAVDEFARHLTAAARSIARYFDREIL